MKDNIIIILLLTLITLFVVLFFHAPALVDNAVAESMETYLNIKGYDVTE